jgi:hypothetical protein
MEKGQNRQVGIGNSILNRNRTSGIGIESDWKPKPDLFLPLFLAVLLLAKVLKYVLPN